MIVSVRRFTFALPRLAWRIVKGTVAKPAEPKEKSRGLLGSFQDMLEAQTNLMIKNMNDR